MRKFLRRVIKGLVISLLMLCAGAIISGFIKLLLWFNPTVCMIVMVAIVISGGYKLAK